MAYEDDDDDIFTPGGAKEFQDDEDTPKSGDSIDDPKIGNGAEDERYKKIFNGTAQMLKHSLGGHVPWLSVYLGFLFQQCADQYRGHYINSQIMRAVVDQTNELTDRDTYSRAACYTLENTLVRYHAQKRTLATALRHLDAAMQEAECQSLTELVAYLHSYNDLLDFSIAMAAIEYEESARAGGFKFHKSIVETGYYNYITPALYSLSLAPPGIQHYTYGNIAPLHEDAGFNLELLLIVGLQLLIREDLNPDKEIFKATT